MHIKAKDTKSEWCYNNYVPLRGIYRTFLIRTFLVALVKWKRIKGMSGIRESNPPPRLGKPVHYRCANSACMYFNNFVIMNFAFVASLFKEPIPGLEPGTYALRMRCSTN